jgi:uncharacterized protein YybS (DUF2232 family)
MAPLLPFLAVPLAATSLLAALPIVLSRLGQTPAHAVSSAAIACVLVLAFTQDGGAALGFTLLFAAWAPVAAEALQRKRSLVAMGAAGIAVLGCVALGLALLGGPQAVEASLASPSAERSLRNWADAAALDPVAAAQQMEQAKAVVATLFPAIAVLGAGAVILVNTLAAGRVLHRRAPGFVAPGELTRLEWPFALVIAFVGAGLLLLAPAARPVAWNGLVVTLFLFGLQGLSVVSFGLVRLFRNEILRALVAAVLLIGPWAGLLALLGLFDQWFDFRRLHAKPQDNPLS